MPRVHSPTQRVQGVHPDLIAILEPAVVQTSELAASLILPDVCIEEPVGSQWQPLLGLLIALPEGSAADDRPKRH